MVVDASVWVSRFLTDDVHHLTSRRWLREAVAAGEQLVAPVLLLPEVGGAITRRAGTPGLGDRALTQLLRVPGLRLVPVDRELGLAAAELAVTLGLKGADAVYVAAAYGLGVPLVTWDREQRERGGSLVRARTP